MNLRPLFATLALGVALLRIAYGSDALVAPADADAPEGVPAIPLWRGEAPASPPGATPPEHRLDSAHVARVSVPRLWLFLPAKPGAPAGAPAVLVIPGGGYGAVAHGHEGVEVARELNRRGIAAAVLIYRCHPQRHPAPLLDARRAFELLHTNAGKWNLDTNRIGVMGFSAGGHLAGLETSVLRPVEDKSPAVRPAFCILVYPVVRLRGPLAHAGSGKNLLGEPRVDAEADALALDTLADSRWPRTCILHGDRDTIVPAKGSEALAARLRELRVPCEFRIIPGAAHGFGWNRPAARGAIRGPSDWLPVVCDWISH